MRRYVAGNGNLDASIFIIGEAPGKQEETEGLPFVGKAGKLLWNCYEKAHGDFDDMYVTNVVKFRPPENRTPTKFEVEQYRPLLIAELELVKPEVVICLGATACDVFLGESFKLTRDRGTMIPTIQGFKIMPTYHPAYVGRNPATRDTFVRDLTTAIRTANERKKARPSDSSRLS